MEIYEGSLGCSQVRLALQLWWSSVGVCFSQSRRRPRPASPVPFPVQPSVLPASSPCPSGYLLLGLPGPLLLQEDARAAGLAPFF